MATLSKDTIKARVRLFLDEQATNEAVFLTDDGEEFDDVGLDSIIEGKAEEALRYIYSVADASLMPWSTLEGIGAKDEYGFDGLAPAGITIQSTEYVGNISSIQFSQANHCFVAVIGPATYYRTWSTTGVDYSMYLEPETDCLYVYTDGNNVKHRYYYNAEAETLDGDDTAWQSMNTYVDSTSVPPYNIFVINSSFGEVWRWNYVRLTSWARGVSPSEAIDVNSPEAATFFDKFSTGTWERPKVSVDYQYDSTLFWLASMKQNLERVVLSCVSRPAWRTEQETIGNDTVDVDYLDVGDKLVDAFYYYLAGLVCQVLGDARQQGFFQEAAELSGVIVKSE